MAIAVNLCLGHLNNPNFGHKIPSIYDQSDLRQKSVPHYSSQAKVPGGGGVPVCSLQTVLATIKDDSYFNYRGFYRVFREGTLFKKPCIQARVIITSKTAEPA